MVLICRHLRVMAATLSIDAPTLPSTLSATDDIASTEVLLQKLEEMLNISKWLSRNGRSVIKKLHKAQSTSSTHRRRVRSSDASSKTPDARRSTGDSLKRPVTVCPRLKHFLNLQPGDEVTRPDVTKAITTYVKENNLQVPSNRKSFAFDEKLATLFDREVGYVTDFFKLQKEINTIVKTRVSGAVKEEEEEEAPSSVPTVIMDEAPVLPITEEASTQSAILDEADVTSHKKVVKRKVKKIPEEMLNAIGLTK